jgi:hypothetical protein
MRQANEPRFPYNRRDRTVTSGKNKTWVLKDVPPEVMYEWVREDRVFKGLFVDWLSDKVFFRKMP